LGLGLGWIDCGNPVGAKASGLLDDSSALIGLAASQLSKQDR